MSNRTLLQRAARHVQNVLFIETDKKPSYMFCLQMVEKHFDEAVQKCGSTHRKEVSDALVDIIRPLNKER